MSAPSVPRTPQSDTVPSSTPGADSRARSLIPLLRRLHFYVGILVAPFLILVALTGLAYAFTPQLDAMVYGEQLYVDEPGTDTVPLADQITAAVAVAGDDAELASVITPLTPDRTTQVVFDVESLGDRDRTVYVDPYTGEVRGTLTTWSGSTPLTTWLDDLHRHLHLGDFGLLYSELAASWLWVLVVSGLFLWLRRWWRHRGLRRLLLPAFRERHGVRRTRSWHATAGLWLTVGLLILSATGLTWSTYAGARFDLVQEALSAHRHTVDTSLGGASASEAPQEPSAGHHEHSTAAGTIDIARVDAVLATAREAGLSGPVAITPAATADTAWTVTQIDNTWPLQRDQIAVDPHTLQVTDYVRWADQPWLVKVSAIGIQAHMGALFGLVNQIVLAALALGLLALVIWGYRMWWQRRPRTPAYTGIVGPPPVRGGWRRVPRPLLIVGVVGAGFVAWAIPLLGISLLVFVVCDLAWAALCRLKGSAPSAGAGVGGAKAGAAAAAKQAGQ